MESLAFQIARVNAESHNHPASRGVPHTFGRVSGTDFTLGSRYLHDYLHD
jgi:hypothetical protein